MKVITVDDQFVNAKGEPMTSVPLVMMAASEIGARQGQELYKEMQKRGWDVKTTAVMSLPPMNWIPRVVAPLVQWMH